MFKLPWMSTLKGFLLCCSAQQLRLFRRAAPYPSREERTEELKDVVTPADRRKALYQKFYKQVQEERKPADCVVLSVTNKFL
uniref:Uncharacterized protein n=1 Tax=Poecilia reticulata TaxID=8081 RepID=A0A3P9Q1E5_POERE